MKALKCKQKVFWVYCSYRFYKFLLILSLHKPYVWLLRSLWDKAENLLLQNLSFSETILPEEYSHILPRRGSTFVANRPAQKTYASCYTLSSLREDLVFYTNREKNFILLYFKRTNLRFFCTLDIHYSLYLLCLFLLHFLIFERT